MFSATQFRFLSEIGEVADPSGWNDPARKRLWTYNLHYFDDLLARDADQRSAWHVALIERWIRENSPVAGAGWEPYPISRRTVNWIVACLVGLATPSDFDASLAAQGRALRRSIEYHLRGNHLFINAKALIFLGSFFQGAEPTEWLTTGLGILKREIGEQILADGGHFELSPMYHALLLEDVLDLIQLASLFPRTLDGFVAEWRAKATAMLAWLASMTHPDGEIGLFNDSAFEEARNLAALSRYASALGVTLPVMAKGSQHLRESGYMRLDNAGWTVIFDVGPVGASYIPGHGHADTLSFELSLGAERLVTNGGTSTYENNAVRLFERGTASHATVEVDGRNSSEVWSSFRVGRRARPSGLFFTADPAEARARHDGYRFLPGRPVHERKIEIREGVCRITDSVQADGDHSVVGRFPLHPEISIDETLCNGWRLSTASGRTVHVRVDPPVGLAVEAGHYACEFGKRLPRDVLLWRIAGDLERPVVTTFEWLGP